MFDQKNSRKQLAFSSGGLKLLYISVFDSEENFQ
jgi:hypothetical protein